MNMDHKYGRRSTSYILQLIINSSQKGKVCLPYPFLTNVLFSGNVIVTCPMGDKLSLPLLVNKKNKEKTRCSTKSWVQGNMCFIYSEVYKNKLSHSQPLYMWLFRRYQ